MEDVIRYATQEGSGRSKQNKRKSILFTSRDTQTDRKVETLPKRTVPLAKCQSIQNVHFISGRSVGRVAGINAVQSASMSNLNLDCPELVERDPEIQSPTRITSRPNAHGHRFLNAIKRYLSLKSSSVTGYRSSSGNSKRPSSAGQDGLKAALWSPRQVQSAGGGVFRPNSARGSTLILIASPDCVAMYGQRAQLEMMFPDYPIEALKSFSSAFIDSKLVYQPDDTSSGDGDGYSSSSFNSVSSLPKRSSSASSDSTVVSSGHSDLLLRLFQRHIQPQGFVITVQSHWRNNETLEFHYQWLLHKKNNSKTSGRNSARRRSSQPGGMVSAASTTTVNHPVARRASVLQRLFNKSELTLHTDV